MPRSIAMLGLFSLLASGCAPFKPVLVSAPIRVGDVPGGPVTRNESLAGWSFVIDPGHGGNERGAPSALTENSPEADLNLAVGLMLGGMLEASGADVTYTRTADVPAADTYVALKDDLAMRSAMANRHRPDFFISVHHNSSTRGDYNRIEMYYKLFGSGPSRALASSVLREFGRLYPDFDSSLLAGNFAVLRGLDGEGILAECAYISDTRLAPRIEALSLLKKEAAAIYAGVAGYAESSMPEITARRETEGVFFSVRSHRKITRIGWGWGADFQTSAVNEDTSEITRFVACSPTLDLTITAEDTERRISCFVSARLRRPPGDSPPLLIFAAAETGIPEARFLGSRIMTVENMSPENTLRAIEYEAPRGVIVLEHGEKMITHYFRSATGKKWAENLGRRIGISKIVAGSHYLLNHTSMPALAVRAPVFSDDLLQKIVASSREQFSAK